MKNWAGFGPRPLRSLVRKIPSSPNRKFNSLSDMERGFIPLFFAIQLAEMGFSARSLGEEEPNSRNQIPRSRWSWNLVLGSWNLLLGSRNGIFSVFRGPVGTLFVSYVVEAFPLKK